MIPYNYWPLRKSLKNVRRPFYAQSCTILEQTRTLAEWFNQKGHNTVANLAPLEEAINAVEQALSSAAGVTESMTAFDDATASAQAAKEAFQSAERKLQDCYLHYKIEAKESLSAAAEQDREQLNRKNLFFRGGLCQAGESQMPIKLVIEKRSAGHLTKSTYSVEPSTRLSAIFWKEAAKDRTILEDWRFFDKPVGGDEIPFEFEREVGSLAATKNKRVVYLGILSP